MIFSGKTDTDGGGFSSIRKESKNAIDLSFANAVRFRVRGDGRTFQFEMRTKEAVSGMNAVPYRAAFATVADEWIEITIPFSDLKPTFHGMDISGKVPELKKSDIRAFGFMIFDKKDGAFHLEVDWVEAFSQKADSKGDASKEVKRRSPSRGQMQAAIESFIRNLPEN